MQRRGKDKLVARQVLGGPREIHRDIPVMQRVVEELDVLAQAEELVRLHRLLQRPIIVVAVEDAGFRLHARAFDGRRQQLHLVAQLGDFLEYAGVGVGVVRHDRAVELLAAETRLPPAEEDHRRRRPATPVDT